MRIFILIIMLILLFGSCEKETCYKCTKKTYSYWPISEKQYDEFMGLFLSHPSGRWPVGIIDSTYCYVIFCDVSAEWINHYELSNTYIKKDYSLSCWNIYVCNVCVTKCKKQ